MDEIETDLLLGGLTENRIEGAVSAEEALSGIETFSSDARNSVEEQTTIETDTFADVLEERLNDDVENKAIGERLKLILVCNRSAYAVTLYIIPKRFTKRHFLSRSIIVGRGDSYLFQSRKKAFRFELAARIDGRNMKTISSTGMCEKDIMLCVSGDHELLVEDKEIELKEKQICIQRQSMKKDVSASGKWNLYQVLGLTMKEVRMNSFEEQNRIIKEAYHSQLRRWHPDKNPENGAIVVCQEIIFAYGILKDPNTRAAYNNIVDFDEGGLSKVKASFKPKSYCPDRARPFKRRWSKKRVGLSLLSVLSVAAGAGLTFLTAGMAAPVVLGVLTASGSLMGAGISSGLRTITRQSVEHGCSFRDYLISLVVGAVGGTAIGAGIAGMARILGGAAKVAFKAAQLSLEKQISTKMVTTVFRSFVTSLTNNLDAILAGGPKTTWIQFILHILLDAFLGGIAGAPGGLTENMLQDVVTEEEALSAIETFSSDARNSVEELTTIATDTFTDVLKERLNDDVENKAIVSHIKYGVKKAAIAVGKCSVIVGAKVVKKGFEEGKTTRENDESGNQNEENDENTVNITPDVKGTQKTAESAKYDRKEGDFINEKKEANGERKVKHFRLKYISEGSWFSKMLVDYEKDGEKKHCEGKGSGSLIWIPSNATNIKVSFQVMRGPGVWCDVKKYNFADDHWEKPIQTHIFEYNKPRSLTYTLAGKLYHEVVRKVSLDCYDNIDDNYLPKYNTLTEYHLGTMKQTLSSHEENTSDADGPVKQTLSSDEENTSDTDGPVKFALSSYEESRSDNDKLTIPGKLKYISKEKWLSKMLVDYEENGEEKHVQVKGSGSLIWLPANATKIKVRFQVMRAPGVWCDVKKYDRFKKCWVKPKQPHIFEYKKPVSCTYTLDGNLYYEKVIKVTVECFDNINNDLPSDNNLIAEMNEEDEPTKRTMASHKEVLSAFKVVSPDSRKNVEDLTAITGMNIPVDCEDKRGTEPNDGENLIPILNEATDVKVGYQIIQGDYASKSCQEGMPASFGNTGMQKKTPQALNETATVDSESKCEWFESNFFDENSDLYDKYDNDLLSLPWVKDYYIGVASKPEKSWKIYITCAKNEQPSMVDLKELFGVNIASFVDFCQENVDENRESNEESLLQSSSFQTFARDKHAQFVKEDGYDLLENKCTFERTFCSTDIRRFLEELEWVRNVRVVDQNEECDKRHLEIVCEYRKVPRIADIVKYFGEEKLPFITYRECSKREWFESNIFNEYSDLCDKYENELSSLPWVKEYYIDVTNEPEKSWQIYIICEKNKIPSMADLKKLFGVNIASFVDFCQENVDENSESNEESLLQSLSREPISRDEQLVQEEEEQEEEEEEEGEYDSLGNDSAFQDTILPNGYQKVLKQLEWIHKFEIVDANEECDKRHLEIVCKFGKVPRIADIVKHLGEDKLPLTTFIECSNREWFESNMFDEDSDLYDKYENDLLSLPWVEEYYIGVASEPEKSWQIYITCAKNKLPSMKDLKKLFGVNIASFVDFCQEDVDRTPEFTRGPASGNEVFNPEYRVYNHGSIGVVFSGEKNHYATTSYHVCYNGRLPKDISQAHQILKDDCENGSPRCKGVACLYVNSGRSVDLGSFNCGLYDDNHDIALLEMNEKLNCSDMVNFLKRLNLRPDLADIAEVKSMFYEGPLPVERVSPEPRRGVLFGIRAVTRCPRYKRCYKIKGTEQDSFASQGDSGSLIYLIYERENIPFAYLSFALDNVFHARNLKETVKELVKHNGRGDFINVNACITQHNNFQN